MRIDKTYKGCQHFEGVMSLPPDPPLSTSSYHLIFNDFCPNIGGNYNATFDLVVTQDVMEHIYHPEKAFQEIARTLKTGGAYVFTAPLVNKHKKTEVWARLGDDGNPVFLKTPEYHGNPVDAKGSPVTMHWGFDIVDFIKDSSGMDARIISNYSKKYGIMGEYTEVVICYKN